MDVSSVIQALGLEGSVGKLAGGASTFVVVRDTLHYHGVLID